MKSPLAAHEMTVLLRIRSAMRFRLGKATAEEGLAEQVASRFLPPGTPIHPQTLALLRDAGLIEFHRVFGWSLTSEGLDLSRENQSEFISKASQS